MKAAQAVLTAVGPSNLWLAGTIIKAGLAFAAAGDDQKKGIEYEDSLAAISEWIPRLFVNQADPICSEYIGYFEHRKKLQDLGAGSIARLTSQFSLGNMFMSAAGIKGVENSEPLHLLPSANLTVNLSPSEDFLEAHELCQWWRNDLNLKCSVTNINRSLRSYRHGLRKYVWIVFLVSPSA
ncbi:hypothetical protein DITRI_Ditri20bG0036300 [Diplodiscus trichospermus]